MPGLFKSATALLSAAAVVTASPTQRMSKRDIITPLPEGASDLELKFQPYLDFDSDGCYNTAAISPDGYTNPGKGPTGTPQGDCRDPPQLENSNAYSRSRCNNGICAIMYEYYFEKDQSVGLSFTGGHRHDWENIVVFTRGEDVIYVAPSCHTGYNSGNNVILDGQHPLVVYHKDGGLTHCFRVANGDDQANPENPTGAFHRAPLVGWDNWPSVELRDTMLQTWNGGVGPKLDDEFTDKLRAAAGTSVPGFDPAIDG
ncbi:necrosis inducing protein-domain-containing protein [Emericellopsis atlantica]|uniref:Necrosis inducing protein-domain-containing protein n=1 Tax=Emericellopsis atlantica TaxID=2614577 RepID=A0A9P7ZJE4_9HYPO|nr:necrosis inducing protein-domain-containing protein [Emericellopsis atlantica]KAG9253031.1 necrosis inducing protein-domain-containing protein [Emericellopsis atlantica]